MEIECASKREGANMVSMQFEGIIVERIDTSNIFDSYSKTEWL